MKYEAIYDGLTEIFREVFEDDTININAQTTARDIWGWDSQAMITLVVAAEERFKVTFRTAEVEHLQCVGDFVEMIAAKRKVAV
jgi:acyl carrier protein